MNISSRPLHSGAAVALCFALTLAVLARDTPPAAEKPIPPPDAAAPAAPAPETPPSAMPVPAAPAEPAAAIEPAAAVEAEKAPVEKRGGMRRIDGPSHSPVGRNRSGNGGEFPLGDHLVPKGSEMREAVSIFGSTTVEGRVHSDVVSVFGNTRVGPEARVSGAAVAVLGRLDSEGEIEGEAVSVLGGVNINGRVAGEVVSVLGDMHLGPKADIGGDLVLVGGKLTKDPGAVVRGNQVNVPILGSVGSVEWLVAWVKQCLLKGRPLAFGPNLGWAWGIAFSLFSFYLILALLFARGIEKCAVTLETRPGASILSSVLTVLLSPVVIILLAVTVVGALLVPFVGAGLFFAGLFGKAVMLAWIGRRFTKFFGDGPLSHPFFAVLIGGLIVLLLYTIWGSFLLYKLLSWLGLGVVVLTIAQAMKRDKAPVPAMPAADMMTPGAVEPPVVPAEPVAPLGATAPGTSAGFTGANAGAAAPGDLPAGFVAGGLGVTPPTPPMPPPPFDPAAPAPAPAPTAAVPPLVPPVRPAAAFAPRAPVISAVTLPRAGFFPRLAAMALDGILVGMVVGFTSGLLPRVLQFNHGPGGVLLALAIYAAVMWKHKGTTIGGIVCGLKIVRLDNREIDWATAIVRALGCFLSLVVAGLGFIWVAFDDEKQSWHDKIAGTTVVRVPKGVSLL